MKRNQSLQDYLKNWLEVFRDLKIEAAYSIAVQIRNQSQNQKSYHQVYLLFKEFIFC